MTSAIPIVSAFAAQSGYKDDSVPADELLTIAQRNRSIVSLYRTEQDEDGVETGEDVTRDDTMEHIRYKKETEVVTFQGKEITLEKLSPVFTPEQEAAKRRELEQQLYEVFRKYADKRQREEAGA